MGQWDQEGDSFHVSLIGRLASLTNASLKGSDLTESRDGLRTCREDEGDALCLLISSIGGGRMGETDTLSNKCIAHLSVCKDWPVENFSDSSSEEEDSTHYYKDSGWI